MPKQVADKYYITHTINPGEPINSTPLSYLADNQCPTYGQLISTKNNYYYPIDIKSDFYGDPIIDSNGHSSTPVINYTSNRLVSKEDITTTKTRINLEIVIYPKAAGGVVSYAAAGGKSVYFNNSIYWKVVDKNGGLDRPLPGTVYLTQISVAIKGTNNFSIVQNVQNTSHATVLEGAEYDGYLRLHLDNPYAVSFPFPVTSKSDIILANVPTISPTLISTPYSQFFLTVRVDSN